MVSLTGIQLWLYRSLFADVIGPNGQACLSALAITKRHLSSKGFSLPWLEVAASNCPNQRGETVAKSPDAPISKRKPAFDPRAFLDTESAGRTITRYKKDQKIFSQGSPSDAVFYIQKGKVKITVVSKQGKEAVIAILGPDEFCGESCLTGQVLRLATARAIAESEIMRVSKSAMIEVINQQPAFSEMFIAHLLTRTIRIEEDLVDQLFNSSEKRLARALLLLANFGKDGEPQKVIAKVNQDTLADMIGTTRSRVSHFMNKFRKLGFIDYNGHLEIHSSLLNVVLHDQPHISGVNPATGKPNGKPARKAS
jgi:CRP/FNR family cyclic AMP-dependent transcriptional regulator